MSHHEFGHPEHVQLAFRAVRQYGMPAAIAQVGAHLQQLAEYHDAPQKYHHTVSRAWVELVAHHVAEDPDCADFAAFAISCPALLDKRLLSRHYRSATLASARARHEWVEPDLAPFPWTTGH
jgi:hypothetical protein